MYHVTCVPTVTVRTAGSKPEMVMVICAVPEMEERARAGRGKPPPWEALSVAEPISPSQGRSVMKAMMAMLASKMR